MKKIYNKKFVTNTTLHNEIFISANFRPKFFGLKLEKFGQIFWPEIDRNKKFIMQRGYLL